MKIGFMILDLKESPFVKWLKNEGKMERRKGSISAFSADKSISYPHSMQQRTELVFEATHTHTRHNPPHTHTHRDATNEDREKQ